MFKGIYIILTLAACVSSLQRLQEVFSWNAMDWNFPDQRTRDQAIISGNFIPENALPVGIEVWRKKVFITVPRWQAGIPATLNTISLEAPYQVSPKLTPYPSWQGNELGNCDTGLSTVYRLKADKCNRLWVLDTGTFGIGNETTNPCPYALNVFDLNTDRRIRRYVLRAQDINVNTFIANIAVDIGRSCEDTFAYFSDELGYGLIVYSWEKNKSWRFDHSFFMPDPLKGDFNLAGLNFQWGAEGIFGISVSPIKKDGFRDFYFSPIASHRAFSISTRILRDETRVADSYHEFKVLDERGPNTHLASTIMDENGIMFMTLVDQNAIGCWNEALPYKPQNMAIVDKDDVALVYPSDVNIDANRNVWVISDRMPIFLEAELDYSDINFRVFTAPLDDIVKGTVCEKRIPKAKLVPAVPNTLYDYNHVVIPTRVQGSVIIPPSNGLNVVGIKSIDNNSLPPPTSFFTTQVRGNVQVRPNGINSRAPQTFSSTTPKPGLGAYGTRNIQTQNPLQQNIPPIITSVNQNTPWWVENKYQVFEESKKHTNTII